jgi:hypothetical protein
MTESVWSHPHHDGSELAGLAGTTDLQADADALFGEYSLSKVASL